MQNTFQPLPDPVAVNPRRVRNRLPPPPSLLDPRPQPDPTSPQPNLKCPRCNSINTKFCYYNNYNLSQPRHFCKSCRRYWTRGGTLRNVPVGGASRKPKRADPPSNPKPSRSKAPKLAQDTNTKVEPLTAADVAAGDSTGLAGEIFADLSTFNWAGEDRQMPLMERPTVGDPLWFDMGPLGGGLWNEVQWGEIEPSLFMP